MAIGFQVGDCLTLAGFPDQQFDLVIDNHVLHCLIALDINERAKVASERWLD